MADLIDRQELLARIRPESQEDCTSAVILGDVRMILREFVSSAPTIDAVPIVRCKDCEHTETDGCGAIYCEKWDCWEMDEDFYCGYGERRGDNAVAHGHNNAKMDLEVTK